MGKVNALIIDDNLDNLGILDELLSLEGVSCTQVQDPRNLEDILQNATIFDVIFLDLELPGIDGYGILEALQEDNRTNQTPVVAYTVHVSEVNRARKLGFHSFLAKPLNADQFPQQLTRILSGERVWATV